MYLASTSPGPARHQWQASAVRPARPILPNWGHCAPRIFMCCLVCFWRLRRLSLWPR